MWLVWMWLAAGLPSHLLGSAPHSQRFIRALYQMDTWQKSKGFRKHSLLGTRFALVCQGTRVFLRVGAVRVACVSNGHECQATWIFSLPGPVPMWLHLCKYCLFYIKSNYNAWRFGTASFESTLKAGLPKGTRISSCVNVCLFAPCISLFVCVLCL